VNNGAPPAVEFEILANYNPLPEGEAYAKPAAAKVDGPRKNDGVVLKPYAATHPAPKQQATKPAAKAKNGGRP
jgi:hypothetical protein